MLGSVHYVVALLAVAALAVILVVCNARCKPSTGPKGKGPAVVVDSSGGLQDEELLPVVGAGSAGKVSREEVRLALQRLAKSRPPAKLKMGAMCYTPAPHPLTADYVCPKCGEKTVYAFDSSDAANRARNYDAIEALLQLTACRRGLAAIRGLDAELDESEFCRKCSPKASQPRLILVVRYPDGAPPHRFAGVTGEDLVLIREFLSGSRRHVGPNEGDSPLKDSIPRLRELLGAGP